jgi:CubicO group peptidase (beta-lactamase class C family)
MRRALLLSLASATLASSALPAQPSPAVAASAAARYAPPRFTAPDRAARLREVLPEVDRLFTAYAAEKPAPGVVWGIVLDGELVHTGATGLANVERQIAASARDSVFRIASMSKSVTAVAILRLRDAGKLTLDDPVARHLPEFRHVTPLTPDAPAVTIRHLLTMTAGFPEDNPWGDRQLAASVAELRAFLREGLALSNPAGHSFEYSNLGYALLGQIVSEIAGEPYQRYISREIFRPLGMTSTWWEFSEVPAARLALGYRREDGTWKPEPLLPDGTYGAMGGLLTTIPDFARYVAFHLAAYPARADVDSAPLRRASLREMHQPGVISALSTTARTLAGETYAQAVGYGFGLRWAMDRNRTVNIGHSGGLPGFGSHYVFYPEHGFAVLSFANVTYAGTSATNAKVAALLLERARLPARQLPVSPILATRTREVAALVQDWDSALAARIVAENFFPDRSLAAWQKLSRETLAKLGPVRSVGEIVPENQLRGTFPIHGDRGRVDVFFTLTPEREPRVQELKLTFVAR